MDEVRRSWQEAAIGVYLAEGKHVSFPPPRKSDSYNAIRNVNDE